MNAYSEHCYLFSSLRFEQRAIVYVAIDAGVLNFVILIPKTGIVNDFLKFLLNVSMLTRIVSAKLNTFLFLN